VDRQVDTPVEQRFFDFLGEQASWNPPGKRRVGDLVAGGLDDDDLGAGSWASTQQTATGPVRAARADDASGHSFRLKTRPAASANADRRDGRPAFSDGDGSVSNLVDDAE
jgi:hypothetical protein